MKSYGILTAVWLAAAAIVIAAPIASAQVDTNAPIAVKTTKARPVWLKAEVIHADVNEIVVREQDNPLAVHSFNYSARARNKINKILDKGGYQSGDKVKILFQPGDTVALDIRGKPSKPF
ncbi:MAG: hypothetical protein ACRD4S_15830 [Candidatus Acidiferrales bacterium]